MNRALAPRAAAPAQGALCHIDGSGHFVGDAGRGAGGDGVAVLNLAAPHRASGGCRDAELE